MESGRRWREPDLPVLTDNGRVVLYLDFVIRMVAVTPGMATWVLPKKVIVYPSIDDIDFLLKDLA